VKLCLCLSKHYGMKAYGRVDVEVHVLFTSAIVGGVWSATRPTVLPPWVINTCTHWIRCWVGPGIGLEDMEK
jgi:hypothetical protein